MELYLIRHGIAVERTAPEVHSDAERWLTEEGKKKFTEVSQQLKSLVKKWDQIFTSPYVRARQTADILVNTYDAGGQLEETPILEPGMRFDALCNLLQKCSPEARVGCVGHEPDLSMMISVFVTGSPHHRFQMKKGGVCRLDFTDAIASGAAELVWLLPPKALRKRSS